MQKTGIEYLTHTWNPIAMRCTPVSRGCNHCWHLRMANRMAANHVVVDEFERGSYAGGVPSLRTDGEDPGPLRRKKPSRIGVQFMGDLFHPSIPFEWVAAIYGVMAASPQHTFFTLTKRPERRFEFLSDIFLSKLPSVLDKYRIPWDRKIPLVYPLENVLEGTSVEDQKAADERISWLLKTPAAKRWVSYEPALSEINFALNGTVPYDICSRYSHVSEHIDLIVAGSETGPGARPAELDWFRSARDQCAAAGVPFFLKQVDARNKPESRLLDWRMHEELP